MTLDPFLLDRTHAAELFLVRHGDALPGPDEIIPGDAFDDLPLSSTGRQQARLLADRLAAVEFQALYCSPLRRCRETAAPFAEASGLTPVIVEKLREVSFARSLTEEHLEDVNVLAQAIRDRQKELVKLAAASGSWDAVPATEPSRVFRQRIVAAIDEISRKHIGERVLVVAHGGVINAFIAEVLEMEKDFFFPCANTSISVVRATQDTRVIFQMNDYAHLRPAGGVV